MKRKVKVEFDVAEYIILMFSAALLALNTLMMYYFTTSLAKSNWAIVNRIDGLRDELSLIDNAIVADVVTHGGGSLKIDQYRVDWQHFKWNNQVTNSFIHGIKFKESK